MLSEGSSVKLTQSLGGAYTVVTEEGYLVRIDGKDSDALGKQEAVQVPSGQNAAPAAGSQPPLSQEEVEKRVWAQLRTCFDPEIPVNIVELGLIYLCQVSPLPEGGYKVEIKMTLTAPGCGMGDVLRADAQGKILGIPGVKQADVQLVWEPHWTPNLMSEAAKLQLGIF